MQLTTIGSATNNSNLWRAVLVQALVDLNSPNESYKADAAHFYLESSCTLEEACDLAGVDCSTIRFIAKQYLSTANNQIKKAVIEILHMEDMF